MTPDVGSLVTCGSLVRNVPVWCSVATNDYTMVGHLRAIDVTLVVARIVDNDHDWCAVLVGARVGFVVSAGLKALT